MTLLGGEGAGAGNSGAGGSGGSGAGGASGEGNQGGAGAGSGGGNSGAGNAGAGGAGEKSWRDTLPEDIRGNATLTKFSDINSLAKSYIEIQGLVGKKGVFPPGEKATPEQMKEFYKQIGQPEFDKFGIKTPEGKKLNTEFLEGFKKVAHDSGLMPQQAQGLLDYYLGIEEKAITAQTTARADAVKVQHDALKKEWGEGYEKQVALGMLAVKELGGDEFVSYLNKTGLGNDVSLIKFMAKVGKLLGEDKIRGEGGGKFGETRQEIQDRIDRIRGDLKGPYFDRTHAAHSAAVREVEGLYQKLSSAS